MIILEYRITLQEETSLENAERIHKETLDALRRQMKWQNQVGAIIGDALLADTASGTESRNVFERNDQ